MIEHIITVMSTAETIVTFKTHLRDFIARLKGDRTVPHNIQLPDGKPPAIVVNFSQDASHDVSRAGYCLVGKIGTPQRLSPTQMVYWAETAAALIMQIRRLFGHTQLTVALACPVAVAFIIGSLLGSNNDIQVIHWNQSEYVKIDSPDMSRVRSYL